MKPPLPRTPSGRRSSEPESRALGLGATFVAIACVALGYFGLGKLGFLFSVPPGASSPLWPAAGLALAAVLAFGLPQLVGVGIGSLVLNLSIGLGSGSIAIALGSVLQTWVAHFVVTRVTGYPARLDRASGSTYFVVLCGPVCALIAPTIGLGSLYALGIVKGHELALNWLSWYVGDAIGLVAVTPIFWSAISYFRGDKAGTRAFPLVPSILMVGILALTGTAQNFAARSEAELSKAHFEHDAEVMRFAIAQEIRTHLHDLKSLSTLFEASEFVTRDEFRVFADAVLQRLPSIFGVAWCPSTRHEDRAGLVARMRSEGFPSYQIFDAQGHGPPVSAGDRDQYLPVVYIEPLATGASALGIDLLSEPGRRGAIELVTKAGLQAGGSKPLQLTQSREEAGAVLVVPVVKASETLGFVSAAYLIKNLVKGAWSDVAFKDISFDLSDTDTQDSKPFFTSGESQTKDALTWTGSLDWSGRTWKVKASRSAWPKPEFKGVWIVLPLSMIVVLMIAALGFQSISRRAEVEALVTVRTQELRDAAATIDAQRAELVAASRLRSLGEMSAGLAHEINNPLAVIHGAAEYLTLLGSKTLLNAKAIADSTDKISRNALRISNIIKGLRSFARDGSDDPMALVPLHVIMSETFELCRARFKHQGVALEEPQLSPDLQINCRQTQIIQVLMNLLLNALDAVENVSKPAISVLVERQADFVTLSVIDNGPGVPSEIVDRIFEPFFTTKPVGKGTGLGLSISRGIIESHAGTLSYKRIGGQTHFTIMLPRGASPRAGS